MNKINVADNDRENQLIKVVLDRDIPEEERRQARNELIVLHEDAIKKAANKAKKGIRKKYGDHEDYIQEAYLGAIYAVEHYNPQKGKDLEAWIVDIVYYAIKIPKYINSPVKIPGKKISLLRKYMEEKEQYEKENEGDCLTDELFIEKMKENQEEITKEDVAGIKALTPFYNMISFEATFSNESDDSDSFSIEDKYSTDDDIEKIERINRVDAIMNSKSLDNIEKEMMHFILDKRGGMFDLEGRKEYVKYIHDSYGEEVTEDEAKNKFARIREKLNNEFRKQNAEMKEKELENELSDIAFSIEDIPHSSDDLIELLVEWEKVENAEKFRDAIVEYLISQGMVIDEDSNRIDDKFRKTLDDLLKGKRVDVRRNIALFLGFVYELDANQINRMLDYFGLERLYPRLLHDITLIVAYNNNLSYSDWLDILAYSEDTLSYNRDFFGQIGKDVVEIYDISKRDEGGYTEYNYKRIKDYVREVSLSDKWDLSTSITNGMYQEAVNIKGDGDLEKIKNDLKSFIDRNIDGIVTLRRRTRAVLLEALLEYCDRDIQRLNNGEIVKQECVVKNVGQPGKMNIKAKPIFERMRKYYGDVLFDSEATHTKDQAKERMYRAFNGDGYIDRNTFLMLLTFLNHNEAKNVSEDVIESVWEEMNIQVEKAGFAIVDPRANTVDSVYYKMMDASEKERLSYIVQVSKMQSLDKYKYNKDEEARNSSVLKDYRYYGVNGYQL